MPNHLSIINRWQPLVKKKKKDNVTIFFVFGHQDEAQQPTIKTRSEYRMAYIIKYWKKKHILKYYNFCD